jgi:regulator of protease activity HflC (stomatin/prohibitin superfamily)
MKNTKIIPCILPWLPCLGLAAAALGSMGCASAIVEPGHRGLFFAPSEGGLRRDVLQPGKYTLGMFNSNRIDDFDVTYSTKAEEIETKSSEGLDMHLKLSVIYRPIVSELYALDTEVGGNNYYGEVVAPEFRSACRGVFARHSYTELLKKNEAIENEVEAEVRRRTAGKHVEISSVTLEEVVYAPEIAEKIRQKIAGESEAARQQAAIAWEAQKKKQITEAEAAQRKLELEAKTAQQKLELETALEEEKLSLANEGEEAQLKAEQQIAQLETQKKVAFAEVEMNKLRAEQAIAQLETQRKGVRAEAEMSKLKAEADAQTKVIEARGEAEAARQMAKAHAEERRAESAGVTPMDVMIHAYDALGHLGGTGTTIVLGDWAHVPNFLFPRVPSLQSAFTLPWAPYGPPSVAPPAPAASLSGADDKKDTVLSNTGPNPY